MPGRWGEPSKSPLCGINELDPGKVRTYPPYSRGRDRLSPGGPFAVLGLRPPLVGPEVLRLFDSESRERCQHAFDSLRCVGRALSVDSCAAAPVAGFRLQLSDGYCDLLERRIGFRTVRPPHLNPENHGPRPYGADRRGVRSSLREMLRRHGRCYRARRRPAFPAPACCDRWVRLSPEADPLSCLQPRRPEVNGRRLACSLP